MGAAEGAIHATDTTLVYLVRVIHTYMIKERDVYTYLHIYIYISIIYTYIYIEDTRFSSAVAMPHVIRCASADACTCAVAIIGPPRSR